MKRLNKRWFCCWILQRQVVSNTKRTSKCNFYDRCHNNGIFSQNIVNLEFRQLCFGMYKATIMYITVQSLSLLVSLSMALKIYLV